MVRAKVVKRQRILHTRERGPLQSVVGHLARLRVPDLRELLRLRPTHGGH
jgi:hypothetical protein